MTVIPLLSVSIPPLMTIAVTMTSGHASRGPVATKLISVFEETDITSPLGGFFDKYSKLVVDQLRPSVPRAGRETAEGCSSLSGSPP